MAKRIELSFNDKKINVELGHTLEEWYEQYCYDDNYWDFALEDVFGGAVEANETIVYWLINGRLYETDEL